jgi:hypothetical protein
MDLLSLVVVVMVRDYLFLAKLKIYFISIASSRIGIRTYPSRVILLAKV